jgi:predicted ATPase
LLSRKAQEQPLLLIFEDLHWIDGETQALLDNLVESLPAARLLLLVNYRPEYSHAWGSKTYYRQLRIDSLPPEGADELLDTLLGTDAALASLKRLLITRTEANPLFLEEGVRSLVETGALVGEPSSLIGQLPFWIDQDFAMPLAIARLPQTVRRLVRILPYTSSISSTMYLSPSARIVTYVVTRHPLSGPLVVSSIGQLSYKALHAIAALRALSTVR